MKQDECYLQTFVYFIRLVVHLNRPWNTKLTLKITILLTLGPIILNLKA